jgi:hypothetical protein
LRFAGTSRGTCGKSSEIPATNAHNITGITGVFFVLVPSKEAGTTQSGSIIMPKSGSAANFSFPGKRKKKAL